MRLIYNNSMEKSPNLLKS